MLPIPESGASPTATLTNLPIPASSSPPAFILPNPLANGGTSPSGGTPSAGGTSDQITQAHKAFIAIAMMIAFVIIATVVAGASQSAGRAMLLLMVLLLLAQGLGHISPFTAWVSAHPVGGTAATDPTTTQLV